MARIAGVDLPKNKRGIVGLTYIYGIGDTMSAKILDEAKISHDKKVDDWDDAEITALLKRAQTEPNNAQLAFDIGNAYKTTDVTKAMEWDLAVLSNLCGAFGCY